MAERKKTELYQELGLQARDLRFQHQVSIFPRNNRIIMRMEVSEMISFVLHLLPEIINIDFPAQMYRKIIVVDVIVKQCLTLY